MLPPPNRHVVEQPLEPKVMGQPWNDEKCGARHDQRVAMEHALISEASATSLSFVSIVAMTNRGVEPREVTTSRRPTPKHSVSVVSRPIVVLLTLAAANSCATGTPLTGILGRVETATWTHCRHTISRAGLAIWKWREPDLVQPGAAYEDSRTGLSASDGVDGKARLAPGRPRGTGMLLGEEAMADGG